MTTVENFPFLSQDEFKHVCDAFCSSVAPKERVDEDWKSIDVAERDGIHFLRIVRTLRAEKTPNSTDQFERVENANLTEDEEDEEVLKVSNADSGSHVVEYHIFLSPSYGVPVVYFTVSEDNDVLHADIDLVHRVIVPSAYRGPVRDVGVMGAISTTDHPIHHHPVWFVHPCQTADALEKAAEGEKVSIQDYLQLWLGIIGISVGLHAPLPAARELKSLSGSRTSGARVNGILH